MYSAGLRPRPGATWMCIKRETTNQPRNLPVTSSPVLPWLSLSSWLVASQFHCLSRSPPPFLDWGKADLFKELWWSRLRRLFLFFSFLSTNYNQHQLAFLCLDIYVEVLRWLTTLTSHCPYCYHSRYTPPTTTRKLSVRLRETSSRHYSR